MGKYFKASGAVRDLGADDLPGVRRLVESRVRDPATGEVLRGEVEEIVEGMRRAVRGRRQARFLVASTEDDSVVGVVGIRPLARAMEPFAHGERPVEMVHAFVGVDRAGQGVGSALVEALEDRARQDGHDEMVLNSGPRYADTGWGFFDRQPGYERRGILRDYYGPGQHAPVWGKRL